MNELRRRLAQAGWHTTVTRAAPALLLTSEDLGERYALDPRDIQRIRDAMALEFGNMDDVFELTPSGFQAQLHYQIYTCVAGTPQRQD